MTPATIRHIIGCARATVISTIVCGIGASTFPVAASPEPAAAVRMASPRTQAERERMLQRADACMAAARHAEAEQILRAVLQESPDDAEAYDTIMKVAAARELAAVSGASRAAQQRLSEKFAIHQTDRFVLFSDVAADLTLQNAQWVERAHEEFMRFANECQLRPLPLQHKLVCVLFDRREEYLAFAQSHDGLTNIAFSGYYSPRWDRVVFSVDQEPARRPAVNETATAQTETGAPSKSVLGFEDGASNAKRGEACTADCHTHSVPASANAAAKCIHETIHQLMFHTRLMRCDVQYPLWICEGLSTAFETEAPHEAFGPDRDYAPRLEAFRQLMNGNDLAPLRELVTVTQITSSKSRMLRVLYQQSYSLATWMCRERKAELRQYLDLMRQQPAGKLSASRHLEIFEQAFGDVDRVEADWLDFEQTR
jgi:hypothetical protein